MSVRVNGDLYFGDVKLNGVESVEIELKVDTIQFNKAIRGIFPKGCNETCRCGTYGCVSPEDPHPERFGPFHVYPEHLCEDLQDPETALDSALDEHTDRGPYYQAARNLVHHWNTPDIPVAADVVSPSNDGALLRAYQQKLVHSRLPDHSLSTKLRAILTNDV